MNYEQKYRNMDKSVEEIKTVLETIKQELYKITFIPKHMPPNHK